MLTVTIITKSRNHNYRLNNAGPGTAYQTKVTHATATNGVTLNTPTPLATGDIAQGNSAPFTLKYYVPLGVTGFNTTVYSTAKDQGGAEYYYPERRSFSSYNQANQITSLKDESGAATAFSYNSGGYLSQKSTGTDVTTYNYNGLDKLTQVSTPKPPSAMKWTPQTRQSGKMETCLHPIPASGKPAPLRPAPAGRRCARLSPGR